MLTLFQDVAYGLRMLRKSPGLTAVILIILTLGIGANTAVFSVIDAVMLRPLPYAQSDRLITAKSVSTGALGFSAVSYPDFFDWRAQNHTLEHLVSYHGTGFTVTGLERAVHVQGQVVSWDLLPALGVKPELGRGFVQEEEKAGTKVALISHALWTSQFASDKSILGRGIRLGGDLYTVVGVMPASFRFPVTEPENAIWTTLGMDNDPKDPNPITSNRGSHFLSVFGRLRPDVSVAHADQDLKLISANLSKLYPDTNTKRDSAGAETLLTFLIGDTRRALLVVLAAVGLVLLIACANIANILLTRVRERQREIAMRSALGASRKRIVRQLLAESLTLSVLGGASGCALAFICTPALLSLIGDSIPRAADAGVDLRVLGFAVALACVAGVIFGMAPAFVASKTNLISTLKEGDRSSIAGHDWLRSSLIVGQIAVGIVLAAGAGLLVSSFTNLLNMNEGFNPDHLLTFYFDTPDMQYKDTRVQFYRDYFNKVRALPGVKSAAGTLLLPMGADNATISFEDPEHPVSKGDQPSADFTTVTPDYFKTVQASLLQGRDFTDHDDAKSPQVIIVNQAFARAFFPGENVIGKKIKPGASSDHNPPFREIVGVVGNIRLRPTQRELRPAMYVPANQLLDWCCVYTVLRSSVDPISLEPSIRQLVASMDRNIPVTQVQTVKDLMFSGLSQPRFAMVLIGIFAALAMVLIVVGLFGVMMYSVTRRTREIGVRIALGAQRIRVVQMVLKEAVILLATGIVIGVVAALVSTSVLESMLYGVAPRSPGVLVLVSIAITLVGLAAAYVPAFRAAKVDPMVALRYE
jgi:predicted permease